jgi:hypothetical protein
MKYFKRSEYRHLKKVVEDTVEKYGVILAEQMLSELQSMGYELTVHHLAHLVRYSEKVVKLYERKKCPGSPTGHFVWLVNADEWAGLCGNYRRLSKCVR